jgi:hypothetical protein
MPLFWHKHIGSFSKSLNNDIDAYPLDDDRAIITKVDALSTRKMPAAFAPPDETACITTREI